MPGTTLRCWTCGKSRRYARLSQDYRFNECPATAVDVANEEAHHPMLISAEQPHPAALEVEQLLAECVSRRQRRSGPGGQHRNKVETAVVFTHQPTGIVGQASERRSQEANRTEAIRRLRINLALEVRREAALQPSTLWQSR